MTELATDLARPRGRYGVDGNYRLIPAPVLFAGYLLLCLAAAVLAGLWLLTGRTLSGTGAAVVAFLLVAAGVNFRRFSRRGKFEVWARLLTGLGLRGDERVLDLGCGRGAVLLIAAKLVPGGSAVGVDIWRADQTGNSMQATLANVASVDDEPSWHEQRGRDGGGRCGLGDRSQAAGSTVAICWRMPGARDPSEDVGQAQPSAIYPTTAARFWPDHAAGIRVELGRYLSEALLDRWG